jgi:hypothetical protein
VRGCAGASAIALLGAGLAGCAAAAQEQGATLTPADSPSQGSGPTEAAPDPEQEDVAAAKQLVVDYWATVDMTGQTEESDWEAVGPYMTSDLWMLHGPVFEENARTGLRTEGDVEVESMTVREYLPSASHNERVTIEACVDFSGRTTYDGDGTVIEPRTPDRYPNEYVVTHGGDGSQWMIAEITARTEETC